jgi:hypothetical protein
MIDPSSHQTVLIPVLFLKEMACMKVKVLRRYFLRFLTTAFSRPSNQRFIYESSHLIFLQDT